jgi:hypothetical protein
VSNNRARRAREILADDLRRDLANAYPLLVVEIRNHLVVVCGKFQLAEDGVEIDGFEVEIVLPDDYPRGIPSVFEVARRIPHDADHHMYENGRACLFVSGERWRYWPAGSTFLEFLEGPVRSFFIGQSLFELTGEWPFGQRSHGLAGIFESYGELLRTRHIPTIARYLEVLSRRKLRPRSSCPCGSRRPIHSCHMRKIAELRGKIPYREARAALAAIVNGLQSAKHAASN